MSTYESLRAALAGLPRLDGAACPGRHRLFCEPGTTQDIADAVNICLYSCKALDACTTWYDSLPARQRPVDCVCAGEWRPAPRKRTA
jgi:hypothetical protein